MNADVDVLIHSSLSSASIARQAMTKSVHFLMSVVPASPWVACAPSAPKCALDGGLWQGIEQDDLPKPLHCFTFTVASSSPWCPVTHVTRSFTSRSFCVSSTRYGEAWGSTLSWRPGSVSPCLHSVSSSHTYIGKWRAQGLGRASTSWGKSSRCFVKFSWGLPLLSWQLRAWCKYLLLLYLLWWEWSSDTEVIHDVHQLVIHWIVCADVSGARWCWSLHYTIAK